MQNITPLWDEKFINFLGRGRAPPQTPLPLAAYGASILASSALDLRPPMFQWRWWPCTLTARPQLNACSQHTNWNKLKSSRTTRTGIREWRTGRAPTVLVSPWLWRAWPMNASCNWVNYRSVQFSSMCCEQVNRLPSRRYKPPSRFFCSQAVKQPHFFGLVASRGK